MTRAVLATAVLLGTAAACGGAARGPAGASDEPCRGAVIADADDVRAMGHCTAIVGDLTITGTALESLVGLERLQIVQGSVTIGPTLSLLATSGLDNLRSIGGSLRIEDNAALTSVSVPTLGGLRGSIVIDTNRRLDIVSTPMLRWADAIDISNNDSLSEVHLPRLGMAPNGLRISDNDTLRSVGATLLQSAGELVVMTNPALVEIVAPALNELEGGLEIELNPALVSIQLPALRRVGGVVLVRDNESFPTAAAVSLAEGIPMKGDVRIEGNAD